MNFSATIRKGIFFFLTVFTFSLVAQGNFSGTVTDEETGEPLRGAQVYDPVSLVGDVTDANGNYIMDLPAGDYNITVSFVGYKTENVAVTVEEGKAVTQNFQLALDVFQLESAVITATFTDRTVFNSPLSLTSLNTREIETLSSNSQADILRVVPGIHAEGGGGEVASNVFVRGMPSGGQYQFTPLQVDGLPVLSAFGLNSSAHDVYFRNDIGIRNLEFVRGGVSTLFGTGSVAGIINYTSVSGNVFSPNKVKYEWGQDGRAKTDFLTSGSLSDRTFYAFSGFYRHDEGPLETGLNTVGAQIRANIKTIFEDGKGVFTVSGQFIDDKVQFYLPYPLQNDNGTYKRPDGNDGETVFTTLTGQATDFSFDTPNGTHNSPIGDGVATTGGYLMADLNMEFENDWELTAKARYANYAHQFNLFLDGDGDHNVPETQAGYLADRGLVSGTFSYASTGQTLAGSDLLFENRVLDRDRPLEDIVSDAYLSKKIVSGGTTHNLTIGTFNSFSKAGDNNWIYNYLGDFRNAPEMVTLTAVDTNGATVEYTSGGYVNGSGRQTSNRHHALRKSAVYAANEMVFENFTLDLGVRYENAKGYITRETGVGSNTFQKGTVETSGFAVAAAGMYKLNSSTNVYVNGSRGYFFPEIRSVRFSSPGVTQSYEPEIILQGELGAKFGGQSFAGNLAAYFVSLSDRRSVDFENDGQGGVTEIVRVQDTRTIGLEASGSYYFNRDVNAFANVTYQKHEFSKVESNPDLEGNWLRRQPQIMAMVGLSYDNNTIDVGVSTNYIGKKYANDANTVELEAYNIMRAHAGYTIPLGANRAWRLGLSLFNLLDAEGITEGSPRQGDTQIGGGDFFVGRPILPRRAFVTATFEF